MEAYCTLIASNSVARPQIVIFWVLKNGMSFPILIANKIFYVTVLVVINFCGTKNSSQETSLQCSSTINMIFSDEGKILIKKVFIGRGTQQRG